MVKSRKLRKGISVDPPQASNIVSMMGYIPTKIGEVLAMFDTGCSNLCMTDDIPYNYFDAIQTQAGPIPMWGVGNTVVKATGEYLISLPFRADGNRRQAMVGLSLPEVTAPLPEIDLSFVIAATINEAKKIHPDAMKWKIFHQVGGRIQLLIGICYSNIHPTPVYTSPTGIMVYEMLLSCSRGTTHLLGGPSEALTLVLDNVGFSNFSCFLKENLENFRAYGPPKIKELEPPEFPDTLAQK